MSRPEYVAVKVGDRYELRRVDPEASLTAALLTALGTMLSVSGLFRRSVPGLVLAVAGAGLAYFGLVAGRALSRDRGRLSTAGERCTDRGPTHQHDAEARSYQCPQDPIDEAVMESFPASDPPAVHTDS